jgi:thiol-disulfide isomerase/thioredoxin
MNRIAIIILLGLSIIVSSCNQKEPQDAEMVYSSFKSEESLDKKILMFEEFKETNSDSELLQPMLSRITRSLLKDKDFSKALEYLNTNTELTSSRNYNSIAWSIFESKENLDLGVKTAKKGIEIARNELASIKDSKPEKLTEEEWKTSKNESLAMILDTYGCIEKELGNNDEALSALEEAVSLTNEEYGDINENYVSVLLNKEENKKAQSLLEKFISKGTDSKNMKSTLNEVFLKLGGDEREFENYLSKFEIMANEKMINRLKDELRNDPAPQFELTDLAGNVVKLSDFKGKTVIVDFWATWCGPCLQSFPAMKKATEKFADNPNVKFLFANTWERVEEKKQNAIDFIKTNSYPFHVLLDDQNEVVEKFNVRGIPTKFIIDKNQNIRFESVGYSGKEEELLEELEQMITMIN